MSSAVVPFELRGRAGRIEVVIEANDDPSGLGCGLLDSGVDAEAARGFPVCTATIHYDGAGYAAALGWIQLVRSTDGETGGADFELDPLALLRDVDIPYAFFGVKPVLFDAPFRTDRTDLDWQAHAFLCFSPDAVMSKTVCSATGFSWGFRLEDGKFSFHDVESLTPDDWNQQVPTLAAAYPMWAFEPDFRSR